MTAYTFENKPEGFGVEQMEAKFRAVSEYCNEQNRINGDNYAMQYYLGLSGVGSYWLAGEASRMEMWAKYLTVEPQGLSREDELFCSAVYHY